MRFKLNSLNQTFVSSKSIMQLTKTIFSDSAIFIEKKRVENRLWANSEFSWAKKIFIGLRPGGALAAASLRRGVAHTGALS